MLGKFCRAHRSRLHGVGFMFGGFALSWALAFALGSSTGAGLAAARYPATAELPGDDYFLAGVKATYPEAKILWHDFGASINNARRADVLLLGNSRLQLALRPRFILPLAAEAKLKLFFLASAPNEKAGFHLELIRRHNLRPKVIVVNVDDTYFQERGSWPAVAAEQMDRWDAFKESFEDIVGWRLKLSVHRLLPRIVTDREALIGERDGIIFRSEVYGCWFEALEPTMRVPITYGGSTSPDTDAAQLEFARLLHRELQARGIRLILCVTPNNCGYERRARLIAEELDVPLIAPRPAGLVAYDDTHLTVASSGLFTEAFWNEFLTYNECITTESSVPDSSQHVVSRSAPCPRSERNSR